MRNERVVLIVVAAMLCVAVIGCQTSPKKTDMQEVIKEEGIVFSNVDGIDLKLDLARPGTGRGPYPAVVFIIEDRGDKGDRKACAWEMEVAAKRGYVAVSIDYRSALGEDPKLVYPFPAQLHDAKCAVRWLRSNADRYNINPSRIGAFGYLDGGHLALMLGLTDSSDGLEGECGNREPSSQVQAVVNIDGVTDLAHLYEQKAGYVWYLVRYVGGHPEEMPEAYKRASPITYVSEDDPPVLSVHIPKAMGHFGVPPAEQGEYIDKKMKEMGLSHTLIMLKDESDYLDIAADYPVWDFFDKHLKG